MHKKNKNEVKVKILSDNHSYLNTFYVLSFLLLLIALTIFGLA